MIRRAVVRRWLPALATAVVGAIAGPTTLTVLAATTFTSPAGLPGIPQLAGVACPLATTCYAVGGDGVTAVVVVTVDGGRTWTVSSVAGIAELYGISCTAAARCVAVGLSDSAGSAAIATTTDGRTWVQASALPASVPLSSVSCAGPGQCMAVGSVSSTTGFTSSLLVSSDGGATWRAGTGPIFKGSSDPLNAVQCVAAGRCLVVGGLAWVTADGGGRWRNIAPPDGCAPSAQLCAPTYSDLAALTFSDADHGVVAGGEQCGGQGVTQCPAAIFRTSDGGSSWTASPSTATLAYFLGAFCSRSNCLVLSDTVSAGSILSSADNSAWTRVGGASAPLLAVTCAPSGPCVAVGGTVTSGVLLTDVAGLPGGGASSGSASGVSAGGGGGGGAANPATSSFATSLPTPAAVAGSPSSLALSALLVVALVLLVVFPSQLFNRTYEENHELIRQWWERRLPWTRRRHREGRRGRRLGGVGGFAAVALVGAALGSLLDSSAGWNQHTLALFAGIVVALVVSTVVGALTTAGYRRARGRTLRWELRALPSALLVGAGCVLVSRLANFHPGYLYGVIGGVAFAGQLSRRDEGHVVALTSVVTLVVSAAAWLLWVPVSTIAAQPGAGFGAALAQDILGALFVGGLVGVVLGLVPLRFLPGQKLAAWHWGAWTAVFAVAMFGLLQLMLRPQSGAAHVSSVPLWTTVGLFGLFGAASLAFWGYFRSRAGPAL